MSSPAAAAISAMITSQVYPQMRLPKPARTVTRQRTQEMEPESVGTFDKGTNQAIGIFQVLLGIGILGALFVSVLANVLSLPSIVMSLTASIVMAVCGKGQTTSDGDQSDHNHKRPGGCDRPRQHHRLLPELHTVAPRNSHILWQSRNGLGHPLAAVRSGAGFRRPHRRLQLERLGPHRTQLDPRKSTAVMSLLSSGGSGPTHISQNSLFFLTRPPQTWPACPLPPNPLGLRGYGGPPSPARSTTNPHSNSTAGECLFSAPFYHRTFSITGV